MARNDHNKLCKYQRFDTGATKFLFHRVIGQIKQFWVQEFEFYLKFSAFDAFRNFICSILNTNALKHFFLEFEGTLSIFGCKNTNLIRNSVPLMQIIRMVLVS